jgi:hypothetical protein
MNLRFVLRGLLLTLPLALAFVLIWSLVRVAGPPPDPTPLPPTILAPRGALPDLPIGLQEWARYRGDTYSLTGSGFLIRLDDGHIVGVTTAHSVRIGDPEHVLEQIALRVAGRADFEAEFDTLRGQPGQPRTGSDLTVDYVLLEVDSPIDPVLALIPDPRGAPQPGERVSLLGPKSDAPGGQQILDGTVQSVSDEGIWVLMDELFNPFMMSGAPFVSQHTGRVVGMVVAGTPRRRRLLLGAHPIGSIVRLAEAADEFPKISEYRR